jgi:serine/threonine protein kinase/Tol biopolymer transport system component
MTLQAGSKFGPYEIQEFIGAGGMGEVYRGCDTRLDRTVAIKILQAHLAEQPNLRERFEREARAVAGLNHPNVCVLFDVGDHDGIHFLVMEYLDGETLAARLTRGPLPLDQALKCASEIADALARAHRQGVVHRDLKPGNVMLTKSGSKLLDFGLARLKQTGQSPAYSSSSAVPTKESALTAQGVIIGTLQYMAPEQLEGNDADARTDIFAFGAVLYELVTGRKAFEGRSQVSLIGSILEKEPLPMTSISSGIPPALDQLVRRCLAKDPDQRWQSAGDLAAQLRWIAASFASESSEADKTRVQARIAGGSSRGRNLWVAASAFFFLMSVGLASMMFYRPAEPVQGMRFEIPAPYQQTYFSPANNALSYSGGSISPNGRRIAFTAADSKGTVRLWVRPIEAVVAQALPGTEGAALPFWSPDSQTIGFGAQGKLKKIDVAASQPQVICDASAFRGGAWNRNGVIIFASTALSALFRVPAAGGEPTKLTNLVAPEVSHRFPVFLPDENHFIYSAYTTQSNHTIYGASLDKPESTALVKAETPALYSPEGHLLFARQGSLFAQAFDAKSLKVSGDPIRIVVDVASTQNALAASVSNTGILIYRNASTPSGNVQMQWFERNGKPGELVGIAGAFFGVELSKNGTRLAVHRHDGTGGDIWLFDSANGPMSRLTFDPTQDNSSPIWSPDGSSIAYTSLRNGKRGVYKKPAAGTGAEEMLLEPSDDYPVPFSWSPDGKFLVYTKRVKDNGEDIWAIPLAGDRKPIPIVEGKGGQSLPQVSSDGKWIAYISNESGRVELHVRAFPTGEGRWQVTTNGASAYSVRWRGDSKELYYIPSQTRDLMAIPISPEGTTFRWGTPEKLFDSGYVGIPHPEGGSYHDYAVTPDGQRFLIPRPDAPIADPATLPINVIVNWTALLK